MYLIEIPFTFNFSACLDMDSGPRWSMKAYTASLAPFLTSAPLSSNAAYNNGTHMDSSSRGIDFRGA